MAACWKCWPKHCNCPLSQDEIEQLKGDFFVAVSELEKMYMLIASLLEFVDLSDEAMDRRTDALKRSIVNAKHAIDNNIFK